MDIKVGDIVLYKGLAVRLMAKYTLRMKLSHFGLVNGTVNDLTLIKSVVLPELKVGDYVIVNNISQDDKDAYITSWRPEHENIIQSKMPYQIDDVQDINYFGLIVRIDDVWFFPYHLEPVVDYDMI